MGEALFFCYAGTVRRPPELQYTIEHTIWLMLEFSQHTRFSLHEVCQQVDAWLCGGACFTLRLMQVPKNLLLTISVENETVTASANGLQGIICLSKLQDVKADLSEAPSRGELPSWCLLTCKTKGLRCCCLESIWVNLKTNFHVFHVMLLLLSLFN